MIHDLYQKAGELHGHYCPGLAIGVRAAFEALRILNVKEKGTGLTCIAESRACYIDGIQMVFGVSWGKGNLEIRDRGKTAPAPFQRAHSDSPPTVHESGANSCVPASCPEARNTV